MSWSMVALPKTGLAFNSQFSIMNFQRRSGKIQEIGVIQNFRKFKIQDLAEEGNDQTYYRQRPQPIIEFIQRIKHREEEPRIQQREKLSKYNKAQLVNMIKQELQNKVERENHIFDAVSKDFFKKRQYQFELKPQLKRVVRLQDKPELQEESQKIGDVQVLKDKFFVSQNTDHHLRFQFDRGVQTVSKQKESDAIPATLNQILNIKDSKKGKFYPNFKLIKYSMTPSRLNLNFKDLSSRGRTIINCQDDYFDEDCLQPQEYFIDSNNIVFRDIINLLNNRIPKYLIEQKFMNLQERNKIKKEIDELNKKLQANKIKEKKIIDVQTDIQYTNQEMVSMKIKEDRSPVQILIDQITSEKQERILISKIKAQQALNKSDILRHSVLSSLTKITNLLCLALGKPFLKKYDWKKCKQLIQQCDRQKASIKARQVNKFKALDIVKFCMQELVKMKQQKIQGIPQLFID